MRKGFALIYALLLTFVLLMVMATVAVALVSDIKLTSQSKATTQAYNMALSGITDGWGQYRANGVDVSRNCSATNWETYYYDSVSSGYIRDNISLAKLQTLLKNPVIKKEGFYRFSVCVGGRANNFIEAHGYSNGQMVSLRADIVSGTPDRIKVYQINSY